MPLRTILCVNKNTITWMIGASIEPDWMRFGWLSWRELKVHR